MTADPTLIVCGPSEAAPVALTAKPEAQAHLPDPTQAATHQLGAAFESVGVLLGSIQDSLRREAVDPALSESLSDLAQVAFLALGIIEERLQEASHA